MTQIRQENSFDIVIAGAGIVGASCAAEFVRNGFEVAIVEPSEIGGGATAAGESHLERNVRRIGGTRVGQDKGRRGSIISLWDPVPIEGDSLELQIVDVRDVE